MDNHAYAYSVLEKLSFCRVAGTEDEKKAAQLLLAEIEAARRRKNAEILLCRARRSGGLRRHGRPFRYRGDGELHFV